MGSPAKLKPGAALPGPLPRAVGDAESFGAPKRGPSLVQRIVEEFEIARRVCGVARPAVDASFADDVYRLAVVEAFRRGNEARGRAMLVELFGRQLSPQALSAAATLAGMRAALKQSAKRS